MSPKFQLGVSARRIDHYRRISHNTSKITRTKTTSTNRIAWLWLLSSGDGSCSLMLDRSFALVCLPSHAALQRFPQKRLESGSALLITVQPGRGAE
jgi:hypothetical protein